MNTKRFGVSMETELLNKLDKFVGERHFLNRSQAIRVLINKHIVEEKWEDN